MSKTSFIDWQAKQQKDPEFVAAANELEPGYQVARLRILRGLTQAALARQPTHGWKMAATFRAYLS